MVQCFKCGRPCGTTHEHGSGSWLDSNGRPPKKEYYCDACWEKACEDQTKAIKMIWKMASPIVVIISAIVVMARMPEFLEGFPSWTVFCGRFIVGVLVVCCICKKFTKKFHPFESIFIVGYLVASFWAFPKYLVPKIGMGEQTAWYCQLGSIGVLIVLLIVWCIIRKKKKA